MPIIYLGTFNPITIGHLLIAETVYNRFGDHIVFVPVSDSYQKDSLNISFKHRFEMIDLAIEDNTHFHINDAENVFYQINGRQPYTIETLSKISLHYADELKVLMGYDNFLDLEKWYQPEKILEKYKVIVYPHLNMKVNPSASALYQKYPDQFIFMDDVIKTNISATIVRGNFKNGKSNKYLLPHRVLEYIDKNKLYRKED